MIWYRGNVSSRICLYIHRSNPSVSWDPLCCISFVYVSDLIISTQSDDDIHSTECRYCRPLSNCHRITDRSDQQRFSTIRQSRNACNRWLGHSWKFRTISTNRKSSLVIIIVIDRAHVASRETGDLTWFWCLHSTVVEQCSPMERKCPSDHWVTRREQSLQVKFSQRIGRACPYRGSDFRWWSRTDGTNAMLLPDRIEGN